MPEYTVINLGEMITPRLDGNGRVFGLVGDERNHRKPCEWRDGKIVLIDGAPEAEWLTKVNKRGDLLLGLNHSASVTESKSSAILFRNGESISLPFAAPDLNDIGQVLGNSRNDDGEFIGHLWQDGEITTLPDKFEPHAINNHGVIVGMNPDPAIFRDGVVTPIEVEGEHVTVEDINDENQVLLSRGNETTTSGCIWQDGNITEFDLPYDGYVMWAQINNNGQVAGRYQYDVGPPYVYEDSAFTWQDGVGTDLCAATKGHFSFGDVDDIDDFGNIIAIGDGGRYLLKPGVAKPGPLMRPEVAPEFVVYRDPMKIRSLSWLGSPGAARIQHFFSSILKGGQLENAINPERVRIGYRENDAQLIVDKNGITIPKLGFLPWRWEPSAMAFDLEGKVGMVIGWQFVSDMHNHFPDMKLRGMLYEDGLVGGRIVNGELEKMPLKELYFAIEAYVAQYVPRPKAPEQDD